MNGELITGTITTSNSSDFGQLIYWPSPTSTKKAIEKAKKLIEKKFVSDELSAVRLLELLELLDD